MSSSAYERGGDEPHTPGAWDELCLPAEDDPYWKKAGETAVDPLAPAIPADIKEKLGDLMSRACQYPSGLTGTDDDRDLRRPSGRRTHL